MVERRCGLGDVDVAREQREDLRVTFNARSGVEEDEERLGLVVDLEADDVPVEVAHLRKIVHAQRELTDALDPHRREAYRLGRLGWLFDEGSKTPRRLRRVLRRSLRGR